MFTSGATRAISYFLCRSAEIVYTSFSDEQETTSDSSDRGKDLFIDVTASLTMLVISDKISPTHLPALFQVWNMTSQVWAPRPVAMLILEVCIDFVFLHLHDSLLLWNLVNVYSQLVWQSKWEVAAVTQLAGASVILVRQTYRVAWSCTSYYMFTNSYCDLEA